MDQHGCLDSERYRAIEINTPDAFEGRDKDIIIVSCVQSLGCRRVGSLTYFRRFHLVLTRAKYALVIVGNLTTLSKVSVIFVSCRFTSQTWRLKFNHVIGIDYTFI